MCIKVYLNFSRTLRLNLNLDPAPRVGHGLTKFLGSIFSTLSGMPPCLDNDWLLSHRKLLDLLNNPILKNKQTSKSHYNLFSVPNLPKGGKLNSWFD